MVTAKILNEEILIAKRDEWFNKLQDLYNGKNGDNAFALNGLLSVGKSDPYTQPEKWVDECLEDIANNLAARSLSDRQFIPVCVEYGIYGVHYIDKILGANVFFKDGQWGCDYLRTPIGQLKFPDIENNETFLLSIRAAKEFVKNGGKFPLFGLPTIASALNIAVNLYGQDILMELLTDSENAKKDLRVINDLLIYIHKAFRKIVPSQQLQPVISWNRTQPPKYGQICGCTTQLISKELYEEVFAPLDEEVLSVYENGGMIHLCGAHTQHLQTFRNMKWLKAVQLNDRATEDLEKYFNGLRDDQIIYLNPCKKMTIENALKITKGKRLVIATTIDKEYKI